MNEQALKHHFMQPCCIDSYLPRAIEQTRGSLHFYTYCDVPMEKFYRAISHKVTDAHVMVLNMTTVTEPTLRFLDQCFDRGWITDLVLSTAADNGDLVRKHFASRTDHVLYAIDEKKVSNTQHLVLYSDFQALTLSGSMYNISGNDSLAAYTLSLYNHFGDFTSKECGNPLYNILLPDAIRHHSAMRHSNRPLSVRLQHFLAKEFPPYK